MRVWTPKEHPTIPHPTSADPPPPLNTTVLIRHNCLLFHPHYLHRALHRRFAAALNEHVYPPDVGSHSNSLCDPTVADLTPQWRSLCSNLGISSDNECAAYWEGLNANALAAFGPLAATAMIADYQLLGKSGETVWVGYWEFEMPIC